MSYTRILLGTQLAIVAGLGARAICNRKQKDKKSDSSNINRNMHDDIIFTIFCFLSAKDVAKLSLVCKLWNDVSKDNELWKCFISQEECNGSIVIAKPMESTNQFFYKMNRQALKKIKDKIFFHYLTIWPELAEEELNKHFLNVLNEENFIIAFHKGLIGMKFIDNILNSLCFTPFGFGLSCQDALLSIFRGCGQKLLEERLISSQFILDSLDRLPKYPAENENIKLLFSQYDFAKLIVANPENTSLYLSIPLECLQQVNYKTFKMALDLIHEGGNRENVIDHVFPKQDKPNRGLCIIQ